MTERNRSVPPDVARDEKLRVIAHVFGDAVAARLRSATPAAVPASKDASQLAWQTNRLIRHLRDRASPPGAKSKTSLPEGAVKTAAQAHAPHSSQSNAREEAVAPGRRPVHIPALAIGEDLAGEHPAVIAHVLRSEPQHVRVSVLRALPGNVSRAVMRRLRNV